MSYCRFGWDGSDVYVFGNSDDELECCACTLRGKLGRFTCKKEEDMIKHLLKHRKKGDCVPQEAIDRLNEEAKERRSVKNGKA
jgi:hypothetical protein